MKKTNSITRILCAALAVVTMLAFAPAFSIGAVAADSAKSFHVHYNFNSGTVGKALVKGDLTNSASGATGLSASSNRFLYANDPTGGSNKVLESVATPYSNRIDYCGEFTFKDDGLILANSDFAIEAKFYIKDAYPVKGKESGEPLSLIAVKSGNTTYPLLRLTKNGYLQLRNSEGSYKDVNDLGKMPLNKWIKLKVIVENDTDMVHLYFNGNYATSLQMAALTAVDCIRMFQNHGQWHMFLDDLTVYTFADTLLDFENFEIGASITKDTLAAAFPSATFPSVSDTIVVKADPENAGNKVSYNNGKAYLMQINAANLYKRDFVVSGKFRFESFPSVSGGAGNVSIFAWVTTTSSTAYKIFCGVDQDGNFLSRSGDKSYEETGIVLNKNQWYTISVHYDGDNGNFNVYLDGVPVCSGKWDPPTSNPSSQNIRVLNNYNNNNFKAYVDDIQIYDLPNENDGALTPDDGVIYNVDFESGFAGTKPTEKEVALLSPYGSYSAHSSFSTYGTLVKNDGNTSLRIAGGTQDHQLDLVIGNGGYDPLKNGTVSLSYDITVEEYPTSSSELRLARWRKSNFVKIVDAANVLNLKNTGELAFFGTPTGFIFEKNVKYNVEVIFNNQIINSRQYTDISVKVSYDVEENGVKKTVTKTVIDSYNAVSISVNNTNLSLVDDENIAYFLDDAGNKCYMPYTGLVKCFKLDAEGNQMTDSAGNPLFVDKLVVGKSTFKPDMIRLFQGSNAASSGFAYVIDNLIVKELEDKSIIDTGFEGWELFNYVKEGDKVTMPSGNSNNYLFESASNNNRFVREHATLVTNNGNTYAQLGGTNISSQKHFYVYDPYLNFYGKDIIIETKVYLSAVSSTTYAPGAMIATVSKKPGESSYGSYGFLLRADNNGYLYTDSDKENPIGQLKVGDWTKIGIVLTGNGTTWNNIRILIDDELASSVSKSFSKMEASRFRFTNMAYTVIGYDDVSIRPYVENYVPGPLTLGFEDESERMEMFDTLSGDWNYGTLGATRTDADGKTVKTTEIREEGDSKYLRVNHSRVKDGTLYAFVDAKEAKFINEDTYLIETAIRYTANTSYGLTVAEAYNAEKGKSAPLLYVKGETNELYVTLRGVPYSITDSSENIIYANGINDEGFTQVAFLVDDVNNTYTLYVNGRLAYYVYADKVLPCIDLPMHFMDTTVEFSEDFIRLLEIPHVKYADSILDVDYINVVSTPNGMTAEVKGSQTRAVLSDAKFDVRFVAGLDTIYAEAVGYEITAEYTEGGKSYTKSHDISSNLVFEKIDAAGADVTAESQGSQYLAAMEICGIPVDISVTITAKPYVLRNGAKVYGEAYTVKFSNGTIVK